MAAYKGGRAKAQQRYNSKPAQVKKRESRNKARAMMIKAGRARKGDGKDVAHRNGNALDDRLSNFSLQSKRKNRSYPRTKTAGKRNPRD